MRSASAGRSDTIEEETVEDMEAERTGVVRAYSLNSKQAGVQKPVLQSHSSTESTDVPTPKSTPNRGKKKLSLKKCKSEKAATEETDTRGRGKAWRGRRGGGGGVRSEMVGRQSPAEDSSPPISPTGQQDSGFPELFRQAILEVDQLTQQLGEEGRRVEEGDSSEGGEEKVVQHKSRPGSKRRRKKAVEAEASKQESDPEAASGSGLGSGLRREKTPSITPTPRSASFTALDTVEGKCEDGRARLCLSSSPPPR